jgi:hypothetical protein
MIKVGITRHDDKIETRWTLRHNFDNTTQYFEAKQHYYVSPLGAHFELPLSGGVLNGIAEESIQQVVLDSARWREVTISVDSVLDADGHLMGPDEAGCFKLFTEWLRADDDISKGVLRLRDQGTNRSVAEILNSVKVNNQMSTFGTRDHYGLRWVQRARFFEYWLQRGGLEAVMMEAAKLSTVARARQITR